MNFWIPVVLEVRAVGEVHFRRRTFILHVRRGQVSSVASSRKQSRQYRSTSAATSREINVRLCAAAAPKSLSSVDLKVSMPYICCVVSRIHSQLVVRLLEPSTPVVCLGNLALDALRTII